MDNKYLALATLGVLISCSQSEVRDSSLKEIPVEINQSIQFQFLDTPIDPSLSHYEIAKETTFPLSEIAEEVTSIELELTDNSIINPLLIMRVILYDNNVIIAEGEKILVFDVSGKFVRSFASKGQGPREFSSYIKHITIDEKNKVLFVSDGRKIISYDLNGKYIDNFKIFSNESTISYIEDMYFSNNNLFIVSSQVINNKEKKTLHQSMIFTMNRDFQLIDSCIIWNVLLDQSVFVGSKFVNYIFGIDSTVYLYYPEGLSLYIGPKNTQLLTNERIFYDSLYRFENNQLIPELKLQFTKNGKKWGGIKDIQINSIYRSSRFMFIEYNNALQKTSISYCYDLKTGKSYDCVDKMFTIRKWIKLIPDKHNPELFYYWQTHFKPNELEEPNPTLYIGRLKN